MLLLLDHFLLVYLKLKVLILGGTIMSNHQRLISFDGTMNFRDLGGYQNTDGQTVKWQKIYRSDSLINLSANDLKKFKNLKITVDCDLRSDYEQQMAPDRIDDDIKYVDAHIYPDEGDIDKEVHPMNPIPQGDMLAGIYQHVILNVHSQQMFKRVLAELLVLPTDQALVFHCSAGKDRTGMASAIILSLLGVDDETIIRDYLLTNQLYDFANEHQLPTDNDMGNFVAQMNLTKGDGPVMRTFLDTIQDGWGSITLFAEEQLGITKHEIQLLRKKYLDN